MEHPPKEEYLLERLLSNVTSYPLSRKVYVIPNGEYTAPFLAALKEAGFSYELIEPDRGSTNSYQKSINSHPVADLHQALNPRRWKIALAELVQGAREYAAGRGKVVRIVPSEQAPLLVPELEKENIPYYFAMPKSHFNPEKEYQIDLLQIEIEEF